MSKKIPRDFVKQIAERDAKPKPRRQSAAFNGVNGAGEAQVVFGEQLAPVLREWKDRWLKYRNPTKDFEPVFGPTQYLAIHTSMSERRLFGIISGEYKFVPLSQAEEILELIDERWRLGATIHIIPNPNWSMEKWVEYMRERGCF